MKPTATLFFISLCLLNQVEGVRSSRRRNGSRVLKKKDHKYKKKHSKGKKDGRPLAAKILVDDLEVLTTVNFNPDGSALIHIAGTTGLTCDKPDADNGVEANCKLTFKEDCDGDNLYGDVDDPWTGDINYFTTDPLTTETKSAFRLDYGLSSYYTYGGVVVITDGSSSYCGTLGGFPYNFNTLTADVGKYPVYAGSKDFDPSGTISITYGIDGTFTYSFDLEGLESNCKGCGIHVHSGVSCETHELVKGHGWNIEYVRDLWTAAGGAVYGTDSQGYAYDSFKLFNGFDIFSNMNHAVVVHAQDGARLGCGVLKLPYGPSASSSDSSADSSSDGGDGGRIRRRLA